MLKEVDHPSAVNCLRFFVERKPDTKENTVIVELATGLVSLGIYPQDLPGFMVVSIADIDTFLDLAPEYQVGVLDPDTTNLWIDTLNDWMAEEYVNAD